MSGLVAADGAHPLSLDLLTENEARELLHRVRLGPDRVAAEPDAVQQIIACCVLPEERPWPEAGFDRFLTERTETPPTGPP